MGEENQWKALCLNCDEKNMGHVTSFYPRGHLYQCPSCKDVKKVIFTQGEEAAKIMEEIGVKIVYIGP